MKKLLCILCCFIALTGHAQEQKVCQGERAKTIATLKNHLHNCLLDFGDVISDDGMAEITLEQTKCLQGVADEIFDAFYHKTKEEKHKQFTNYINAVQNQYHNLESRSDIGRHFNISDFYYLGYVNSTYVTVYDMVEKYITYMEKECIELSDTFLKEMNNTIAKGNL